MNILGVDTSTKRLCVGIMNHRGRILEYNLDSGTRHTESVIPTIKKALMRMKLLLYDIDYFAVGLGPGSFTGLRISLATIKGLAQARGVPIIGLPTLDILTRNALSIGSDIICPLIDAKRNLVFTAFYELTSNHKIKRRSAYLLINIEELLRRLRPHRLVTFLGDGLCLYRHRLKRIMRNSIFLNEGTWYPKARNLIEAASDLIDKKRFSDARRIKPIYLYPKECQIRN